MTGFKRRILRLRNLLHRQGRSRDDADDVIQEAFVRLLVYSQTEDVREPDAFLTRAVLNLSIDMHRKEHCELYVDEPIEALRLMDIRPAPDEDLAAQERLTKAGTILDGLNPRTREIFLMHRLEGFGCAQIAARFAISVSAVEKHIARAVLALMDAVER